MPGDWRDVPGSQRSALRRRWASTLPAPCYRCGGVVEPDDAWDLEHDPPWSEGGRRVVGVSHSSCNRAHGARLRNAPRRRAREQLGRRNGW